MKLLRELTIMTPNKPGKLSQILRALANAKINLQSLNSTSGYDLNLVRLVTSDFAKTENLLTKLGYQVTEATVLAVTILDNPGQLAKITGAFGKAKINIDYIYATAAVSGSEALVIIHVSDLPAGEQVLRANGWL